MNRRELLKLFGVGATVVPIVGGAAVESAAATLIEVPKVELASAGALKHKAYGTGKTPPLGRYYAELIIIHGETGQRWEMDAEAIDFKQSSESIDVSTHDSAVRRMIPAYSQEAHLIVFGGRFRHIL